MPTNVPPFLIFFLGALLVPFVRGLPRMALLLLIPVLGAYNVWGLPEGYQLQYELMGYTLTPVRADRLSLLFGYLFHLAAFIAITYSLHLKREDNDTVQHVAAVIYAGSALGAVFAGDFVTLFDEKLRDLTADGGGNSGAAAGVDGTGPGVRNRSGNGPPLDLDDGNQYGLGPRAPPK